MAPREPTRDPVTPVTGLLLINLGSPDAPTPSAVRRYLRQFLSDPRVIDINPVGRWLLLELMILPTRPRKSAQAYRKIWTDRGSPLLFHSRDLRDKVAARLGDSWRVELAMRYGSPSIPAALDHLLAAGVDRIVVFPLYPQHAASSTGSSLEEVYRLAARPWVVPSLDVIPAFYDDPGFLAAFAAVGAPIVAESDYVLFSFHGLPERQVRKAHADGGPCVTCDATVGADNRDCYRAQCYATARGLVAALSLQDGAWSVSFQSRLGRTPWIQPYTDHVLPSLASQGKKRVAVYCPAFVADCLETLEEIGIRAKHDFLAAGGESLTLVPSLNSSDAWVEAVVALVTKRAKA